MIVSEMRERLSQAEFTYWTIYYGRKAQRQELAAKKAR